ncbi:MAG TPA: type II toxin-antitoxin system HicA family toxin [Ktedonobacteraceae bacterium]|nr:type II toxin-antitoxin system HicA family toxin [Ktedonobacteraceae bacterium]
MKLVKDDGWYHVETRGSHRQYKHPVKPGKVTIPGHPGDDMPRSLLSSILKQAQINQR